LADNKVWYEPECTGSGDGQAMVGPSPRAFHVAVAIGCHMFVFGGRSGRKRFLILHPNYVILLLLSQIRVLIIRFE